MERRGEEMEKIERGGRREEWSGKREGGRGRSATERAHHLIAGEGEALHRAEDLEDIHSG